MTWNGQLDKNILERLGIRDFQMLNIICYDKNFNQNFTLQLEKFSKRQIIFEIELGTYNKLRRLLNLEETHKLICLRKHRVESLYDPRTDVKLTKCVFDCIVRKFKYDNLIKYSR